jgi:hypothetical protein
MLLAFIGPWVAAERNRRRLDVRMPGKEEGRTDFLKKRSKKLW